MRRFVGLVALAVFAPHAVAAISPQSQTRVISADGEIFGEKFAFDSDVESAPDFGDFDAMVEATASTSSASFYCFGNQESSISADGVVAMGSGTSSAISDVEGLLTGAWVQDLMLVQFGVTEDTPFRLEGFISSGPGSHVETRLIHWHSSEVFAEVISLGEGPEVIDVVGVLPPGSYVFRVVGNITLFADNDALFTEYAYDLNLRADGTVSVPPSIADVPVRLWPNPAATRVAIEFDDSAGQAPVDVFDLTGRAVRSLSANDGLATWDLVDDRGAPVAAGVYFVRPRGSANATRLIVQP